MNFTHNLEGALQTEVPEVLNKISFPQSKGGYSNYMYYRGNDRFCIYSWLENPLPSTDSSYVKYNPPSDCDFPNNQCGACGCPIRYKICN